MGLIMVAEDSPIREILLENGVVLKPVDVAGRMVWTDSFWQGLLQTGFGQEGSGCPEAGKGSPPEPC